MVKSKRENEDGISSPRKKDEDCSPSRSRSADACPSTSPPVPMVVAAARIVSLSAIIVVGLVFGSLSAIRPLMAMPSRLGVGPVQNAYNTEIPNSLYVPGGGFSGFWYLLGQLQSLHESEHACPRTVALTCEHGEGQTMNQTFSGLNRPVKTEASGIRNDTNAMHCSDHDHDDPPSYVCFSSACLAVIAANQGWSLDRTYNVTKLIQDRWHSGEITTADVLPTFIDSLLADLDPYQPLPEWMQKRFIILTTTSSAGQRPKNDKKKNSWWHSSLSHWRSLGTAGPVLNVPTDYDSLRQQLIQTSWIPGITGDEMWFDGHMDGGFTTFVHPECSKSVYPGWDWSLYRYAFDPSFTQSEVLRLVQAGKRHGVP